MMQKQLAYMLGRQQIFLDVEDEVDDFDDLSEIMSNSHLNNNFLALAREVGAPHLRCRCFAWFYVISS